VNWRAGTESGGLHVAADREQRVNELARGQSAARHSYVREAILEHLDDIEGLTLAVQQMNEIRAGQVKTISLKKGHEALWPGRLT
jgi:predicted DNA-binding protein